MFVHTFIKKYKEGAVAMLVMCAGVAVAASVWFVQPKESSAQLFVPFAGYPVNIIYNCLCSGSIMVTIEPTPAMRRQGQQEMNLLYVWAADLLSDYVPDELPVPTAYLWCGVFWTGEHTLLGNYFPGAYPCYAYAGTGCVYDGQAQGAIVNVGSTLY